MANFEKVLTPKFRVSFPSMFTPSAPEGSEPKYAITMLFKKGEADLSALKTLAAKTAKAKWPDKIPTNFRSPFRDGDVEKPDTDGYAGCIFIRASSKLQPGLVDQQRQPILREEEFYAGCYAHATVTCYAYSKAGNNGVAFGMQNLQKLGDVEHFSVRSKPEEDFEVVGGEAGFLDGNNDDAADSFL
jgi:hypothetical protein